MALTMPLWQPLLAQQVCVFVVKDPVKNAMSLAANGKKSSESSAPPRLPARETGLHALVLHVISCHVMSWMMDVLWRRGIHCMRTLRRIDYRYMVRGRRALMHTSRLAEVSVQFIAPVRLFDRMR